ncbi:MAG: Transcriptional regulator of ribosomal biogenesis proteins [Bogoriella megaspora]|nr:MAG: Transcriptional regulator of ribosomal biogenesis proteins [Bogoriella megaspora]
MLYLRPCGFHAWKAWLSSGKRGRNPGNGNAGPVVAPRVSATIPLFAPQEIWTLDFCAFSEDLVKHVKIPNGSGWQARDLLLAAVSAKLDSPTAVPSLSHSPILSDQGRGSKGSTPADSPLTPTSPLPSRRAEREKDLYFSWFRKAPSATTSDRLGSFLENEDLLFQDTGISDDPLFPSSPGRHYPAAMTVSSPPIDISPPARFGSSSPGNQTSNLTSALQGAGPLQRPSSTLNVTEKSSRQLSRQASRDETALNGISYYGSGAQPITMAERPRKESLAGSLVNGSWGGVSVGSWIRDDIVMGGASPMNFQSPSFHSSSYLPKMEANFMRDYVCCGNRLDSLHDLLQHYESSHASSAGQMLPRTSIPAQSGMVPGNRDSAAQNAGNIAQAQTSQPPAINTQYGFNPPPTIQSNFDLNFSNQFQTRQDSVAGAQASALDEVDPLDMEMDDTTTGAQAQQQNIPQPHQQMTGQNHTRLPPLNMNVANAFQHQGLRTSTPTTPQAGPHGFQIQNNPTVSSVNTPTLATFQQQLNRSPPDSSSYPGTPDIGDPDFGSTFDTMDMGSQYPSALDGFNGLGLNNVGTGMDGSESQFIDQPAKRLYSRTGGPGGSHLNGQGATSTELARLMREQQLAAGSLGAGPTIPFPSEENKPFKCPVIGCEKSYKNQNGLKYHKQHGHQNQQLKQNEDGSFSIVDPNTSMPYPGTLGMEKEKPYKCDVCHKRYKNLNGLKYHRQHSPPCNPDLRTNSPLAGAGPASNPGIAGMGVNVAGTGLLMNEAIVGMNDGGVY